MKQIFMAFAVFYFGFTAVRAQEIETGEDAKSVVVWKDVTIPARTEYTNIVVMSGLLEFYGKTEKLVVLGGKVRIHEGAHVKTKMVVLGGTVEQLEGASVAESSAASTEKLSILSRIQKWGETWIHKWKNRFSDDNDTDDDDDETSGDSWSKIFVFPFILTIPLAILLVMFGLAVLFNMLAPRISKGADKILRSEPFASLFLGTLAYFFMTPFVAILTLSIIGIPLVPVVILITVIVILAGFFTSCRSLGALVLEKVGIEMAGLHILLGLILLYGILFMPFVGKLLAFFILIAGTGAVLRSFFDSRKVIRFGFGDGDRTVDI